MKLENGVRKVTKGSMVIMKGLKDRYLHYLKDNKVTGALTAMLTLMKMLQGCGT